MIYLRCRLREPFAGFVFEFLLFASDVSPGKKSRPLYFVSFLAHATFAGKIALFLRQSRYNVAIKIYLGRQNITMSIVLRSLGRRVEWTLSLEFSSKAYQCDIRARTVKAKRHPKCCQIAHILTRFRT